MKDIRESYLQQVGIEATFIGFMNSIGQIRLMFERCYAQGEMDIDTLDRLQQMIAGAQDQVTQNLQVAQGSGAESKDLVGST